MAKMFFRKSFETSEKKFGKICLLHFDAHADLRDSYNGNKFSHASAIRRCLDNRNLNVISFGIRNISSSEIPFLNKKRGGIAPPLR